METFVLHEIGYTPGEGVTNKRKIQSGVAFRFKIFEQNKLIDRSEKVGV